MKTQLNNIKPDEYKAPSIESIDAVVEAGIALSIDGAAINPNDYTDGDL